MKKIFFVAGIFLIYNLAFSQISNEKAKQLMKIIKTSKKPAVNPQEVVTYKQAVKITDTVQNKIDGKIYFTQKKDSLVFQNHPYASHIENEWMRELYSSGLFDTINRTITNLDYKEVVYDELPTDTLKSRLAKLNQKTPFNIEYNPSLESVIKMFLKNRREHLERLMTMSKFYFPMFEQELDNYDIPLEVKYLAIVESALNPRAKSRVGATGLWQFMFATGKMYGLDVSSYVDERSDPIKSTKAACKYLAKLYEIFGDWDLALAAYNSGPGNVSKAIRRSGGYQNYWNLRPFLPRETAGYVPSFLATMYIFEYAGEHGFNEINPEKAYFETDTVHVKKLITFDQISELIGVNVEEIQFFNPSYKLDIIPYIEDENYSLRLPVDAIGKFVSNEDTIYAHVAAEQAKKEKPLPQLFEMDSRIRYRVKSGDYLGKIANKFGVRISDIKRWNGLRNNNINIGQRLTIYPKKPVFNAVPKTTAKTPTTNQMSSDKIYTVIEGDTLWSISRKFPEISVENIKEWNDISGTNLKPGMKLKLCKC
ncbi:lytic transglycosylase domain-containing protein [Abyssalbus ytuae]|uniref:LysM peptidoglycan-binding domain-containing protein n=1 Tax=Abyssalbus ytuae TaxID=2926907 RepID=A0A9E6ZYN8_9FLAO|nr:lytic transglycosylase domain-containing protein [Abyssalbus ytuae]UOB19396.1 LysM peptidoglycan-binding domain-containing protein [Abyssalbus ytuae]